MKCAADKKIAAVCSAIVLTHEVKSHAWICQIEEWWGMAVMGTSENQNVLYNSIR